MAAKPDKTNTYLWEGTDKKGGKLKGEARGASIAIIKADLRRQGIAPLKVKKRTASLFGKSAGKITSKDIALFSRQLSTMMSSGVPLVQGFDIVGRSNENEAMRNLLLSIKTDIEGGSTLAQALRKHPRQFDDLFCNLVSAGEHAGILESLLDKIANYKEKMEIIKGKIKKALYYPAAVLSVAFVITVILLLFVVPQFESLFKSSGAELPLPTQIVINMSRFMQDWWWLIFAVIISVIWFTYVSWRDNPKVRARMDGMLLKAPIFGLLVRKATIARFARTLSTMAAAGVPLVEAMESVAGAAGNDVYRRAILGVRDQISTGNQLQMAMQQTNLFPTMVVQMVAVGEESGALDNMLAKVADYYEREVDDAVDSLSSLMEPLIMVVLGVLIGGLVIAMYMPIFKMGQVV